MRFLLFNIAVTCALLYLAGLTDAPPWPWQRGAGAPPPAADRSLQTDATRPALVVGPRLATGSWHERPTATPVGLLTASPPAVAPDGRPTADVEAVASEDAADGPPAWPAEALAPHAPAMRPTTPAADTGQGPPGEGAAPPAAEGRDVPSGPPPIATDAPPPPADPAPADRPQHAPGLAAGIAPKVRPAPTTAIAPEIARMMLPTDDPEVQRRRAEVLDVARQAGPEQPATGETAVAQLDAGRTAPSVRRLLETAKTPSMAPAERRASLLGLAERMESAVLSGDGR